MSALVKVIRKIRSVFKEKPTIEPDNFELEHFLLYHGLVGSSPENQRDFKDVKADIKMAVEEKSSTLMAICLKLLPLWWEEKLETIFDEILSLGTTKEELIEILCPERGGDTEVNNSIPLFHENWKVRSNAAKILSYLEATEQASEIADALSATTDDTKLAFCHLVYALAKLNAEESKPIIASYLKDNNPWIVVDACGSYACLTKSAEDSMLVDAILDFHLLDDYLAVQVNKYISIHDFINSEDQTSRLAGYKLISGLVRAIQGTFSTEFHLSTDFGDFAQTLVSHTKETNSPCLLKALLDLKSWYEENPDGSSIVADIDSILQDKTTQELIEDGLNPKDTDSVSELAKEYAAIILVGELNLNQYSHLLESRVKKDYRFIDQVLDSLSKTEVKTDECASKIIEIIDSSMDLEERTEEQPSAQPVLEDANQESRTYFWALKALGKHQGENTLNFLLKATDDYASDKRDQAIKSLIECAKNSSSSTNGKIEERVARALADNSLQVRYTAVKGIASLGLVNQVPKIIELTGAKEVSMTAEAIETLSELAKNGHKELIDNSVRAKLKTVRNQYHQDKLKNLLENISGSEQSSG